MTEPLDSLKGKKVLVTGGAGFIGSNLVDRLAEVAKVTVLDNLSSGSLANLKKSQDRISFVKGDVLDQTLVKDLVADMEYVFHLAANVGNIKSIEQPIYDMEVNIKGTLNLLEACRHSQLKRLVYSSSAAVFGEAKYLPIDENHPVSPESPYAVGKLAAEKYCFVFRIVHGIPATALRYFNVYGPRQDTSEYANAIAIFMGKIRAGKKPLTVFGDGKQTRDFIFVQDIVNANILAATAPAAVGEFFNIGTGKQNSIETLITVIKQVTGQKPSVTHADARAGEVRFSVANIEKAGKLLGYSPQTDLQKGLQLTWEQMINENRL